MTVSLTGRNAIVTGSTSGIGLGLARSLAAAGANVVLNGFGPAQEIEAIRTGLQDDHGIRAIYSDADMSKGAEILDMVRKAEQIAGAA